jgi:hypothetical protein
MPAIRSAVSRLLPLGILAAVLTIALGPFWPYIVGRLANVSLHAPNWSLWAGADSYPHSCLRSADGFSRRHDHSAAPKG